MKSVGTELGRVIRLGHGDSAGAMVQLLLDVAQALKPYTKVFEYLLLLLTAGAAVFATRKIKAANKHVRQLVDASERLRAQADETASLLSAAADDAIERMKAAISEEIINASLGQATQGAIDHVRAAASASDHRGSQAASNAAQAPAQTSTADRDAHQRWWQPVVDTKLPGADQPPPKLYWKNNIRIPLPVPGTWLTVWQRRRRWRVRRGRLRQRRRRGRAVEACEGLGRPA
jgi:hypothetical protein